MLSHIIYSLSFKMIYIVYLGQKRGGGGPPGPPSKSATAYGLRICCKFESHCTIMGGGGVSSVPDHCSDRRWAHVGAWRVCFMTFKSS